MWQRFETLRNRLPLIDHRMIADAEAHHLSEEYCSSTINQFLMRVLQLSPGEAASRVRAAAAVGPRTTMLGEPLDLSAAAGRAATRRCRERGESADCGTGHGQTVPARLRPASGETAEQLLTDHAAILGPAICAASPTPWSMPPTPTAPNRSMINCNRTAATWN